MATSRAQRTGIWVIAVAMIIGTVVGFIAMILNSQNQAIDQKIVQKYQTASSAYQTKITNQQNEIDKEAPALSKKYYPIFGPEKSRAMKFNANSVKKLGVETIKAGTGKAIDSKTSYLAYYIGFTPDGKIFDSSLGKNTLKSPLVVQAGPGSVIQGWTDGLKAKKIGGIYELTIPSSLAYGSAGSGDTIKPNTPLKFIVMPVKTITTYTQPQVTQEIIDANSRLQQ